MNEFKVNDYLTLKLEEEKTNIYVKEVLFNQCKYLMLNIPIEETENFDEIESIDEAADILGWTYDGQEGVKYEIDPETEFWGHCSNLHAWYENNYDTRLLHSNLSFPLLKELAVVGDPIAKYVFKEEIVKRFESGYPTVIVYIVRTQLLDYLDREELSQLIDQSFSVILTDKLPDEDKYYVFSALLKVAENKGWKQDYFSIFFEIIDKLPRYYKYGALYNLINAIKDSELIHQYYYRIEALFLVLEENIKKLTYNNRYDAFYFLFKVAEITGLIKEHTATFLEPDYTTYPRYHAFYDLLKLTKETELKEEDFSTFLEIIDKLPEKYHVFYDLIKLIKDSELTNDYYSSVEALFLVLIDGIDKLTYENIYDAFFWLLNVAKITGLVNEYFPALLESINKFADEDKIQIFFTLLKVTNDTGWMEKYFPMFLKNMYTIPDVNKYNAFSSLLSQIKEPRQLKDHFLALLETIEQFTGRHKYPVFNTLINSINSELLHKYYSQIENKFLALLNSINKLHDYHQYDAFFGLIISIKSTELLNNNYSQIETHFLALLNNMDKIPGLSKRNTFSEFIKLAKRSGMIKEHIPTFLDTIDKLPGIDKYSVFKTFVIAIRGTELMDDYCSRIETKFLALLNSIDRLPNYVQYRALFDLIISFSKSPKSWKKYYPQIKNQFFILLNNVDKLPSHLKNVTYSILIQSAKNTNLENELAFKEWVEKNPNFKRRII